MAALRMKKGDTFRVRLPVTLGGDPFDLEGSAVYFKAKHSHADADESAVISKDSLGEDGDGGITFTSTSSGQVLLTLDPVDTAELEDKRVTLFYDIKLKDSEARVFTLDSGKLIVDPSVILSVEPSEP